MDDELKELIKDNSNNELKMLVNNRIKDLFWQTLLYLEIAFPHLPGDNSENEKSYQTIRSKILRIGNDAIRGNDDLFNSFVTFKVYDYQPKIKDNIKTEIYYFKNNLIKGKEKNKNGNQEAD